MSRLPLPDLTTDILLRLPAKSLLRFRCLSSSFRHEIDSSDFAKTHLQRSIATKTHRKLFLTRSSAACLFDQANKDLYAVDFDDGLKKPLQISNQFTDLDQYSTAIVATCNGLMILLGEQEASPDSPDPDPDPDPEFFIWNPTTRQMKKLPPCPGEQLDCPGLGYDSASDDYKVVTFVADFISDTTDHGNGAFSYRIRKRRYKIWVFSLKSNSWRYVQYLDLDVHVEPDPEGFANGFLYYHYSEVMHDYKMGCFDLANEVFITLPEFYSPCDDGLSSMPESKRPQLSIKTVEGNVLLLSKNVKDDQIHEFYSPVVDEVGGGLVGGNWSEAFTFDSGIQARKFNHSSSVGFITCTELNLDYLTCAKVNLLAYSKDGTCVLIQSHKDIFWYNMEKKTRHGVEFLQEMCKTFPFDCYVLWESLVSLGNDGVIQV